jgi:hypothetical protein
MNALDEIKHAIDRQIAEEETRLMTEDETDLEELMRICAISGLQIARTIVHEHAGI